jgi:hypothetical protein
LEWSAAAPLSDKTRHSTIIWLNTTDTDSPPGLARVLPHFDARNSIAPIMTFVSKLCIPEIMPNLPTWCVVQPIDPASGASVKYAQHFAEAGCIS